MSDPVSRDVAEQRAIDQLTDTLVATFNAGGPLAGKLSFALFLIRDTPQETNGSTMLVSNVQMRRVAEVLGGWMIAKGFAAPIPIPPLSPTEKPN